MHKISSVSQLTLKIRDNGDEVWKYICCQQLPLLIRNLQWVSTRAVLNRAIQIVVRENKGSRDLALAQAALGSDQASALKTPRLGK